MQTDLEKNVGPGTRCLANRQWNTIEWIHDWQKQEDGSHICHVIALIEHTLEDEHFYIEETTHQWTVAEDLKIWTSWDWDMDIEARFPLQMLANHWQVPIESNDDDMQISNFPSEDNEENQEDSPNRPALKRRTPSEQVVQANLREQDTVLITEISRGKEQPVAAHHASPQAPH